MSYAPRIADHAATIRDQWVQALQAGHVLMGSPEAMRSEVEGWLSYLGPAIDGDTWAARELHKLVAIHARSLGAEGRPASAGLMQIVHLSRALQNVLDGQPPEVTAALDELARVVVDAHALGQGQRLENLHRNQIQAFSPVLRWGDRAVIGFLLGPMDTDLIDGMLGRLLRERARVGADSAVLDIFGADEDDRSLHVAIKSALEQPDRQRFTLVITGARDGTATRKALEELGVDLQRIRLETDVSTVIDGWLADS